MDLYARLPTDVNNRPISDRGEALGTKRFTGVGTGGTAITLPCECKEVLIICDDGADAWKISGTITGATDECPIPSESLTIPICAASGAQRFTLYAVTGTTAFSILLLR
jgi:hypothetical protein